MPFVNYCANCGEKLGSDYKICPYCGEAIQKSSDASKQPRAYNQVQEDTSMLWVWGLIGFFVVPAGLVLFLVLQDERPQAAKAAGTGALVSVIISVVAVMFILSAIGLSALV